MNETCCWFGVRCGVCRRHGLRSRVGWMCCGRCGDTSRCWMSSASFDGDVGIVVSCFGSGVGCVGCDWRWSGSIV